MLPVCLLISYRPSRLQERPDALLRLRLLAKRNKRLTLQVENSLLADPLTEREVAAARAILPPAEFAAAWEEGRAMPLDQAIECALTEDPDR